MKNPDGCPTCLHIWESRKVDPRGQLKTVNVELAAEDARRLLLTLKALDGTGATAQRVWVPEIKRFVTVNVPDSINNQKWAIELRTFRTVLMHALKEVM